MLVSTKNLDQVDYNPKDHTAVIGPGRSWEEAQKGLEGTGRTIVGGRMGGVGIGGYMLGGMWLRHERHPYLSLMIYRWHEFSEHPIWLGCEQCLGLRSCPSQWHYCPRN